MRHTAVLWPVLLFAAAQANAQSAGCWAHWQNSGAPFSDLDRSLQLAEPTTLAPVGVTRTGWSTVQRCAPTDSLASDTGRKLAWDVLPVWQVSQLNDAYPRPQQDGLRWAGRGASMGMQGGIAARWGPVSAAIAPVIAFQQNDDFQFLAITTPGLSQYGSFYHVGIIDRPQRFGASSSTWVHPGQSFVRVDAFGAAAGISTENMRWGPARRNPLLMSGAAPGFPHLFAGTSKPLDLRIAHVSVEAIWGRLAESEYFDSIPANDDRLFAGLVATISPKNSGLTLGITRSYLRTIPVGGLSLSEQIVGPYTGIRDNPGEESQGDNQLLSVFMSWVLPESAFELYGEYARDDHWEDAQDLLMELDHARAYTIGLEKVFTRSNQHRLRVAAEATTLAMSQTWQSGRGGATFYTHGQIRQGYTHRGQMLGAPIGGGSDAQYVSADYLTAKWLGGLYYERIRYDNDAYYQHHAFLRGYRGHDTEWTLGVRGGASVRNLQIVAEFAHSTRYNRDFFVLQQPGGTLSKGTNMAISLGVAWLPSARRNEP